jgi:hypothetical protein
MHETPIEMVSGRISFFTANLWCTSHSWTQEMKAKQQGWEKLIPSSKEELGKNAAAVTILFSETHLNTTY